MSIATTRTMAVPRAPLMALLCAALAQGGCAGFSKDGGFDPVAAQTRARLNQEVRWTRTAEEEAKSGAQVAALLAHELSADDAVQIALLNNRALQASFEGLGISEADLVQSGRLPNPKFTFRHAGAGPQVDIEETLTFNVLSLITAPYARTIEKHRFAEAQSAVVIDVVTLANETRQAYFAAVAARESARYLAQVKAAAETGAELAQRMLAAGNWTVADQAREQGFYADATQRLTRAQWLEESTRQKLLRLLGLSEERAALRLAEALPELPRHAAALPDVDQSVLQDRIDLRLRRMRVDELAHELKLTQATRFINVLDAGPARVLQGTRSQPYEEGYEVSVEIPLFDGGGPRVRKAQAIYAQAVDRFAQAAVDARAEIRTAYAAYRATFDVARRQRDDVVPTAKLIAAQDLLRYNASLISIFDLLADARGEIASVDAAIQSTRDFWMAKSDLDTALLGGVSMKSRGNHD
ncbi:MAG: TolC family protein [Steroidobacteraceae bacterium]